MERIRTSATQNCSPPSSNPRNTDDPNTLLNVVTRSLSGDRSNYRHRLMSRAGSLQSRENNHARLGPAVSSQRERTLSTHPNQQQRNRVVPSQTRYNDIESRSTDSYQAVPTEEHSNHDMPTPQSLNQDTTSQHSPTGPHRFFDIYERLHQNTPTPQSIGLTSPNQSNAYRAMLYRQNSNQNMIARQRLNLLSSSGQHTNENLQSQQSSNQDLPTQQRSNQDTTYRHYANQDLLTRRYANQNMPTRHHLNQVLQIHQQRLNQANSTQNISTQSSSPQEHSFTSNQTLSVPRHSSQVASAQDNFGASNSSRNHSDRNSIPTRSGGALAENTPFHNLTNPAPSDTFSGHETQSTIYQRAVHDNQAFRIAPPEILHVPELHPSSYQRVGHMLPAFGVASLDTLYEHPAFSTSYQRVDHDTEASAPQDAAYMLGAHHANFQRGYNVYPALLVAQQRTLDVHGEYPTASHRAYNVIPAIFVTPLYTFHLHGPYLSTSPCPYCVSGEPPLAPDEMYLYPYPSISHNRVVEDLGATGYTGNNFSNESPILQTPDEELQDEITPSEESPYIFENYLEAYWEYPYNFEDYHGSRYIYEYLEIGDDLEDYIDADEHSPNYLRIVDNIRELLDDPVEVLMSRMPRLRRLVHWSHLKEIPDNDTCCICLDEYLEGDDLIQLICNHMFHTRCVNKWLQSNITCPFCRRNLVEDYE